MTRLHKKCLIASSSMHALLVVLLVFGSAFFVSKERPVVQSRLQFYPSRLIEGALAGGGGDPNIARTDDVQKGSPQAQPTPTPPAPKPPQPRPPEPQPPPPKPAKPIEKVEPPKVETVKADPVKPPKTKPVEAVKPPTDSPTVKPRKIDISELKSIPKDDTEKVKAKAEAEARAEAQRVATANRRKLAEQLGSAATDLQRGFQGGTKVQVGGPGGEAFASYGALVQAAYSDAWQVIQDLNDDDSIALVRVTVARDGRVLSSQIIRRSGNATMDRSVQRALDKVRDEHLPAFPDFIKDLQRSFTIEFNLKTRKLLG